MGKRVVCEDHPLFQILGKTALATDPADAYEDSRANPFVRR